MTESQTQSYRKYERVRLTEHQEQEMVLRYGTTDEPLASLAAHFGVHNTYPYRILAKWHVDWRRDNGTTFQDWARANNRGDILPAMSDGTPIPEPENKIARDIRALASNPTLAQTPKPKPRMEIRHSPIDGTAYQTPAGAPQQSVSETEPDELPNAQAWHVSFLPQSVLVHASSIENAVARARARYPGLTIGKVEMAEQ